MNMLLFAVVCAATVTSGWLIIGCLPWPSYPRLERRLLKLSLAAVIGIGITSCFYFMCWPVLKLGFFKTFLVHTSLVFLLLAFQKYWRYGRRNRQLPMDLENGLQSSSSKQFGFYLCSGFMLVLAANLLVFIFQCSIRPHGDYDAMMDWNLKARSFYFLNGQIHQALNESIFWSHPEYPLLLPFFITVLWDSISDIPQLVPHMVAFIFTFASVLVMWSLLSIMRGKSQASLAGLVLLTSPFFVLSGTMLIADAPIGCYFLSTVIALCISEWQAEYRMPFCALAGLSAGLAIKTHGPKAARVFFGTDTGCGSTRRSKSGRPCLQCVDQCGSEQF
jgi:hypothetical protein